MEVRTKGESMEVEKNCETKCRTELNENDKNKNEKHNEMGGNNDTSEDLEVYHVSTSVDVKNKSKVDEDGIKTSAAVMLSRSCLEFSDRRFLLDTCGTGHILKDPEDAAQTMDRVGSITCANGALEEGCKVVRARELFCEGERINLGKAILAPQITHNIICTRLLCEAGGHAPTHRVTGGQGRDCTLHERSALC